MPTSAKSTSATHTGVTAASTESSGGVSAVLQQTSRMAKAQHALSLFANLRADLHTLTSSPLIREAAHATPEARASSATGRHTSVWSVGAHKLGAAGQLPSSTPAAIPDAGDMRLSSLHGDQRNGDGGSGNVDAAPQTYTDAEIESLSPAQLRQQLRVSAAVTQRLHQRVRRLESALGTWKRKYADREANVAVMAQASEIGKEGCKECKTPLASSSDAADPSRSTAASAEAAAARTLKAAEERSRQLEFEVKRLEAHKETLTKRLYVAEKTVEELKEELCIAACATAATSTVATSSAAALAPCTVNTTGKSVSVKSQPETLEGGAVVSPPTPLNSSGAAPVNVGMDHCSNSTGGCNAAAEDSVAYLQSTVRQLQRRLELSEAHAKQAMQIHLDTLLRHPEPTPSTVALVNADVQRLFQLMQQQLLSNAVQQQVERARMSELICQLQSQQRPL
ncbi:hypothetical protein JKF63_06006 [Porcisia hertigi]|uniref:Uncharacterized protein n=1 Tax=Porcisia hertigi TaxID=2761500 RepID=A0A836IX93_9TRYP|nr:hypothetical protein JKF63_06006 [Porcisia hertigi]